MPTKKTLSKKIFSKQSKLSTSALRSKISTALESQSKVRITAFDYPKASATPQKPSYRVAATRNGARSVAGHYAAEQVHAFRVLAAAQDKDVQQLLAEGINLVFERYGIPDRIPIASGRRTKQQGVTE